MLIFKGRFVDPRGPKNKGRFKDFVKCPFLRVGSESKIYVGGAKMAATFLPFRSLHYAAERKYEAGPSTIALHGVMLLILFSF